MLLMMTSLAARTISLPNTGAMFLGSRPTLSLTESLKRGLVAEEKLSRLDHEGEARVDALHGLLLLLCGHHFSTTSLCLIWENWPLLRALRRKRGRRALLDGTRKRLSNIPMLLSGGFNCCVSSFLDSTPHRVSAPAAVAALLLLLRWWWLFVLAVLWPAVLIK